eukprot:37725-Prorocentrum_minimum.AAC.1
MERELSDSEDEEESDDNEGSKAQVNLKEGKGLAAAHISYSKQFVTEAFTVVAQGNEPTRPSTIVVTLLREVRVHLSRCLKSTASRASTARVRRARRRRATSPPGSSGGGGRRKRARVAGQGRAPTVASPRARGR